MCFEIMAAPTENLEDGCPRKHAFVTRFRWRTSPPRPSEEAPKPPGKAAVTKKALAARRRDARRRERRHPGASAPENTTQYLMESVYVDMADRLLYRPPSASAGTPGGAVGGPTATGVNTALGLESFDYESSLVFQRRDFDEVLGALTVAERGRERTERTERTEPEADHVRFAR